MPYIIVKNGVATWLDALPLAWSPKYGDPVPGQPDTFIKPEQEIVDFLTGLGFGKAFTATGDPVDLIRLKNVVRLLNETGCFSFRLNEHSPFFSVVVPSYPGWLLEDAEHIMKQRHSKRLPLFDIAIKSGVMTISRLDPASFRIFRNKLNKTGCYFTWEQAQHRIHVTRMG